MKIFKYFLVLSLSLSFGNILADDFECKAIIGDVLLSPSPGDATCPILKNKPKTFPDLIFLHELGLSNTCFVGVLEGTLGEIPITGKVFSGLTANSFEDSPFFTAASFIKIRNADNDKRIGIVATHDVIMGSGDDTKESLAMIKGTKNFNGGKGHFEIHGNVFTGASFNGTLCFED